MDKVTLRHDTSELYILTGIIQLFQFTGGVIIPMLLFICDSLSASE